MKSKKILATAAEAYLFNEPYVYDAMCQCFGIEMTRNTPMKEYAYEQKVEILQEAQGTWTLGMVAEAVGCDEYELLEAVAGRLGIGKRIPEAMETLEG